MPSLAFRWLGDFVKRPQVLEDNSGTNHHRLGFELRSPSPTLRLAT